MATSTFSAGQQLTCTITKVPAKAAQVKTLTRLMQMDPKIAKGLRKAQERRRRDMRTYSRGGVTWYVRELVNDIAEVKKGNSWAMTWTPHIANDFASVQGFVAIK